MLLTAVKTRIPIDRSSLHTVFQRICLLVWMMVLTVKFESHATEQVATHLPPFVTGVGNEYCVSCHESEVKKGGLDLERLEGHRPGNFKPSVETIAALRHVKLATVSPPTTTTSVSTESRED